MNSQDVGLRTALAESRPTEAHACMSCVILREKSQLLFEKNKTKKKTVGILNRGQVQQPCEEQVQPKEIEELIIVIRQQTMTKKMLVKTESVDMTGGGGLGGGVQGSDG